jgi:hypothetical protein
MKLELGRKISVQDLGDFFAQKIKAAQFAKMVATAQPICYQSTA